MTMTLSTAVPAVVHHALDAIDASDTASLVRCFNREGFVDDWGRVYSTPREIRRWSDAEFIGGGIELSYPTFLMVDGNSVVHAQASGKFFSGSMSLTFTVPRRLITALRISA